MLRSEQEFCYCMNISLKSGCAVCFLVIDCPVAVDQYLVSKVSKQVAQNLDNLF